MATTGRTGGGVAQYARGPRRARCRHGGRGATVVLSVRYQGNADGAPTGVVAMLLKAGDDGKAKIQVDGKRSHLVLPDLASLAVPLRVQLQAGNGRCWEASYSAGGVIQQDGERFKARSD